MPALITQSKSQKPLVVQVNSDNRLEVAKDHFYNNRCRCLDCLSHWLGVSAGEIVVMSHDGKHRMVLPGSANGRKTPPKR